VNGCTANGSKLGRVDGVDTLSEEESDEVMFMRTIVKQGEILGQCFLP